jgi:hypothetical protein
MVFQYGFLGRLSGTGQKYSIAVIIIEMKKPKYQKKSYPSATLSTTNQTWNP